MSAFADDDEEGASGAGDAGAWPAFTDLFAATTLVLLICFGLIAFRYIDQTGTSVKVEDLYSGLKREEPAGRFTVFRRQADVLITLEEDVTFPTDGFEMADMRTPARQALRRIDEVVNRKEFQGLVREIEILGHADRRGNPIKNWRLSANRAVTVAAFLIDSMGRSACSIVPSGKGAYFPRDTTVHYDELVPGSTRDSILASDRRIEILLHPVIARSQPATGGCRDVSSQPR